MARKTPGRITIPPAAQAPNGESPGLEDDGDDARGDVEIFDAVDDMPALSLFRETGDAGALADASFADWNWQVYRLRTVEEVSRDRKGSRREWMLRLEGPLDLGMIKRECGGGSFELWGYYGGRLRTRLRQDIGGPRRSFDAPEPAPRSAAPSYQGPPVAMRDDSAVLRLIESQGRVLEKIAERLQHPQAQAAAPLGVADVLALADRLNNRETPNPSGDVLKELVSAFRMGMEVKSDASPAEKSTTELVLEKLGPVAEKIALAFVQPRRPAPRTAAAPGTSRAEVVETAAAAEQAEPATGSHRWPALIEALANAVASGVDPADFCTTVELLLPPQELGMLRLASAGSILEQIRASAGAEYPILATEQAAAFVQAVLAELNATDGSSG